MTRTFFVGEPTSQQREMYEIVLAAQCAGVAAVEEGVSTAELDGDRLVVRFAEPQTRVAPGQSVVLYTTVTGETAAADVVVAGGIATRD